MFGNTLKRSVATLGVAAGLLVAAGPAGAATPVVTGPAHGAPTTVTTTAPATSQGIIMRDGGVCDPIRHMGC
jgi:multidrug efflux pump subunit AcrA (membrane-fusion protein)